MVKLCEIKNKNELANYYSFNTLDLPSKEELLHEWQLIKDNQYSYESHSSWNKLIKTFQFAEFYKHELQLWRNNKIYKGLPLQAWLYKNRLKYISKGYGQLTQTEILRGFKIAGIHIGYSFHSPFYIKQFIKDFDIKSIYDPCGGWGHRLLGAASIDCRYIYNDINATTASNCLDLAAFINYPLLGFYCEDAASFTPKEDYQAVFTCPPYHNVEVYSTKGSENLSYTDFLIWWKSVITSSCINKESCNYFAFIINHTYEKDMTQECINAGLQLIETHILGSTKAKSHLTYGTNQQKYEKLLVFSKI